MKIHVTFLFFMLCFLGISQNLSPNWCGQHLLQEKLLKSPVFKNQHEKEQRYLDSLTKLYNGSKGVVYKIPVVFHIVHNNGEEKIDRDQALDALAILNKDLRLLDPDTATIDSAFANIAADSEIEFVLATKAPDGSCFSGLTYTESPYSYNLGSIDGDDQVNAVMMYNDVYQGNWSGHEYLNVFVCGAVGSGIAGYTYYPSGFFGTSMSNGIWLRHDYCGSIGTGSPYRSRTFIHEVGHWLNLPHTWGSSNEPGLASNCNMDDGVSDTPNTIGSSWCNYNETTCGSHSNIENHMEYSSCRKMFTDGQKARMRTALTSNVGGRSNLITPINHAATGIDVAPPFCKTDFFAERYIACTGDSILFEDYSYHAPVAWNWVFEGGIPDSSTLEEPYVTYPVSGVFDVDLAASGDSVNFLSEQKNDLIVVMKYNGEQLPFFEGFENTSITTPEWVSSIGNWDLTNQTSYNGSYCIKVDNAGTISGAKHEIESKTFDLSDTNKAYFNFRYAFAKKNKSNTDYLKVLGSNDCGKSWSVRKVIPSSQLETAPIQQNFVPKFSEWEEVSVTSLIGNMCVPNFRFKFEFISGGGNDLYIDNINISYTNNTSINSLQNQNASIHPNPSDDVVYVKASDFIKNITIYDCMGREVLFSENINQLETNINVSLFNNGFYHIKVGYLNNTVQVIPFIKN